MGRLLRASAIVAALAFLVRPAGADDAPRKRYKSQPLNLQHEQLGVTNLASVGRSRMRNGDYAGALEAFDAALRSSTDPTIYRDRGLCHEKLGEPYPAIDDLRVYLTNRPDEPDSDGIRTHLANLEESTTGKSSGTSSPMTSSASATTSSASADAPSSTTASATSDDDRPGDVDTSVGGGDDTRDKDTLEYVDPNDDTMRSPLRAGKGWGLAPFFAEHKWLAPNVSFGDSASWSESAIIQVRYSFSPMLSLVLEAGYEHFNSTAIQAEQISGLTSLVALEFRLPIDKRYTKQFLIAPGLGFEHLVVTPSDPTVQGGSEGGLVPRIRFGYRHMIAKSTGIEASLDAGVTKLAPYSEFPFSSNVATEVLLGANVGVVWGL